MMEIWKPVKGYEGLYEISDHGRVKSFNYRQFKQTGSPRLLCSSIVNKYLRVTLFKTQEYYNMKEVKNLSVHRLVLEAFIGPPPFNHVGHHIDHNKTNNHLSNLKWITPAENVQASVKRRANSMSKLTEGQVLEIREKRKLGTYQRILAEEYTISRSQIAAICSRASWKHV